MKLTTSGLTYVRAQGLQVWEKCDSCGKVLNQTVRYTITGKPEVYCSAVCRDSVFFGDPHEVMKRATPEKCAYCGGSLNGKKRGSIFCDDACRKARSRKIQRSTIPEVERSRTPTQLNQLIASLQKDVQGDCIASGTQPSRNAPNAVSARISLSVEAGLASGEQQKLNCPSTVASRTLEMMTRPKNENQRTPYNQVYLVTLSVYRNVRHDHTLSRHDER